MKTDHKLTIQEEKNSQIKENVNSVSGFFSISYAIILIASISYNVGYFKYINPQIVGLMTLSDYINNTIHNVWIFLIPVTLFYSGSLAYLKKTLGEKFWQLIILGMTILVIASFTFLKGISKERIWPILKSFIRETYIDYIILILISLVIISSAYFIYRLYKAFLRDRLPQYTLSFFPIILFILLVFVPYIIGSSQGKIENGEMEVPNYKCHAISIVNFKNEQIDNIYILKHIEKGLIIKEFNPLIPNKNSFFFMTWGNILKIIYHSSDCLGNQK